MKFVKHDGKDADNYTIKAHAVNDGGIVLNRSFTDFLSVYSELSYMKSSDLSRGYGYFFVNRVKLTTLLP